MSSLDSLAQLVAPDLSRIATENQATPSDIAKYGAFALAFCPTHQRFEVTSVYSAGIKERFFARTDPTALNDDPLRLGN